MGEVTIDPGAASVVASVLLLVGVVVQSGRAQRKGKAEAEQEVANREEVPAAAFAENIAFNRYIDEKIEDATRPLREKIDRLVAQTARVTRVLRILREAFRQYIRDTARTWGTSDQPPTIDPHIREILLDDDLDNTFGADEIDEIRRHQQDGPPPPA